jgi:hypothetical protein
MRELEFCIWYKQNEKKTRQRYKIVVNTIRMCLRLYQGPLVGSEDTQQTNITRRIHRVGFTTRLAMSLGRSGGRATNNGYRDHQIPMTENTK